MPYDVRPTTETDLPELSRFLAAGFGAAEGAAFASVEVLRWKFFDPVGVDGGAAPRSYLACDGESGRIVGHVGVCPGRFRGPGLGPEGVSTLHMIDWLAAGAGASLMLRAHRGFDTQYGFGGSEAGRGVGGRGGYALASLVPVYQRVLRPGYRWKAPGRGPAGRAARVVADAARRAFRPAEPSKRAVEISPVAAFGAEVAPVLDAYRARALFTSRGPDLLNHLLRYPRGGLTGWHLRTGGELRGFALLSVVNQAGGVRAGKVVDLLLDDPDDADLWHASALALTAELSRQGADVAVAVAGNDWSARSLRRAGFDRAHDLEFRLRDKSHKIPRDVPVHLTPLEADYAYT